MWKYNFFALIYVTKENHNIFETSSVTSRLSGKQISINLLALEKKLVKLQLF